MFVQLEAPFVGSLHVRGLPISSRFCTCALIYFGIPSLSAAPKTSWGAEAGTNGSLSTPPCQGNLPKGLWSEVYILIRVLEAHLADTCISLTHVSSF